jgi:hypothetical protein
MAYPLAWETDPPEIPRAGEKVTAQMSQFASELRSQAKEGKLHEKFSSWLYDYEKDHPPPGGATFRLSHEQTTTTTTTDKKELELSSVPPPSDAALVARAEGTRADRLMEATANGIRELRLGFGTVLEKMDTAYAGSLDKLNEGVDKLNSGFEELRAGYAELRVGNQQLQADQRSFLGLLFPHMERVMEQGTETMAAYRKAVLSEARAEGAIAAAQAGASEDGGIGAQAEKAIVGLLTEAAKEKLGIGQPPAPKAPAAPAPEVKK